MTLGRFVSSLSRAASGEAYFRVKAQFFPQQTIRGKKQFKTKGGGVSYAAPACEIIDLVSETAVLQASTNSFTIQEWEDDEESLTF